VNRTYVSPTGNDTTGNGTAGNPYLTPRRAIIATSTSLGSVIELASGIYPHTDNLPNAHLAFRLTTLTSASLMGGAPHTRTNSNSPNTQQVVFENLAVLATGNTALGVNGNGNWDVTYRNCNISTNVGRAGGNNTTNAFIGRFTAENSSFAGGGTGNPGVLTQATEMAFTADQSSFARSGGSGIQYQTSVPMTVTLNGCSFGSGSGISADRAIDIDNCPTGTKLIMTNCSVTDVTANFIDADPGRVSILATDCQFNASAQFNLGIETGGLAGTAWADPEFKFVNCSFSAPVQRFLNIVEGADLELINTTMVGNRHSAIQINSTTGDHPTSVTVVNCILDGGTTTVVTGADSLPPAINLGILGGTNIAKVVIDRSTITGKDLQGVGIGSLMRSTGLYADSPSSVVISNSVFEGSDIPIHISDLTTVTAASNVALINNTIIRTADSSTSYALLLEGAADAGSLKNSIVLGFSPISNKTLTETTNLTTGDPKFVKPNPFSAPSTAGISDYNLTVNSTNVIGVGTPDAYISLLKFDRAGLDRSDTDVNPAHPNHTIGAFEYNPNLNPVNPIIWWQF
jgi:hypothetical protein